MQAPGDSSRIHALPFGQHLAEQARLGLDGGPEPQPRDARQPGESLVGRLEEGIEGGEVEGTALGAVGRVKPRAPMHAVRVERAAEVQRSEEHTSELQSPCNLVCRLLLEKKKKNIMISMYT